MNKLTNRSLPFFKITLKNFSPLSRRFETGNGVCSPGCKHTENSEDIERLLIGNKKYVNEKILEDPEYFIKRAKIQTPKYLLIGCSDSRVPPNEMTKTNPGEIFIHRNIANQVIHSDLNCMSVLQFAVEHLKVEHIIVMGHTKCGGIMASKNKNVKGLIDNWLQNIRDVAFMNKEELEKCKTDEEYFEILTELNIRQQVLNVCKTNYVQKAWANGVNLRVHGWLTNIENGLITDLKMSTKEWLTLKNYYDYNFH
jgi:carbonic anhydrase